ncbi:MAG: DMT family transporter, partial [Bacteroidia bacterium]|nr:DMT family transporter [Bacteroidia bacterium]
MTNSSSQESVFPLKPTIQAQIAMSIQTVLIGMGYTFARSATIGFDILTLMTLRLSGSTVLMFLLWRLLGEKSVELNFFRSQWKQLVGLAIVGILVNQFCFMVGLKLTTPASSSLLYALTPMLAFCFSAWFFRTEEFTRQKLVSILLALLGVIVVILARFSEQGIGAISGNLVTLTAVLMWAFYIAFSRPLLQTIPPIQLTFYLMLIGTLLFLPV